MEKAEKKYFWPRRFGAGPSPFWTRVVVIGPEEKWSDYDQSNLYYTTGIKKFNKKYTLEPNDPHQQFIFVQVFLELDDDLEPIEFFDKSSTEDLSELVRQTAVRDLEALYEKIFGSEAISLLTNLMEKYYCLPYFDSYEKKIYLTRDQQGMVCDFRVDYRPMAMLNKFFFGLNQFSGAMLSLFD
jgi:hypothetical protein